MAPDAGPCILVVEDDASILRVLRRALEREGYRVFTVRDGQEGLELIEQCQPRVVLSDIRMPRMDGYEFARSVHTRFSNHRPKVILMTAFEYQPIGDADLLIRKPFDLPQLLDTVKRLLHEDS